MNRETTIIIPFVLSAPKEERDDLINPYWIEDKALKRGEVDYLPGPEVQFFKDLIEKYLYPLLKNPQEQVCVCVFVLLLVSHEV